MPSKVEYQKRLRLIAEMANEMAGEDAGDDKSDWEGVAKAWQVAAAYTRALALSGVVCKNIRVEVSHQDWPSVTAIVDAGAVEAVFASDDGPEHAYAAFFRKVQELVEQIDPEMGRYRCLNITTINNASEVVSLSPREAK